MKIRKKWALALSAGLILALSAGTTSLAAKTAAKIGGKSYPTLQAAVDAAKKGQVVKVTGKISTKTTLSINKDAKDIFVIDFGSYTYKYKGSGYAIELKNGTVTLKNAKLTSPKLIKTEKGTDLTIPNGTYKGIMITNMGTTAINGGIFKGTGSTAGEKVREVGLLDNYGTMFVRGGTFKAGKNTAIENRGTITITDGTFTSSLKATAGRPTPNDGLLLDNRGKAGGAVSAKGATATITGGTFSADVGVVHNCGTLTVKAGTLTSNKSCTLINAEGTVTISGGIFKNSGPAEVWTITATSDKARTNISAGAFSSAHTAAMCMNGGVIKASGGTYTSTSSKDAVLFAGDGGKIELTGGNVIGEKTYAFQTEGSGRVSIGAKVKIDTKYRRKN